MKLPCCTIRFLKYPYKRNAFGNHSKGIINLNLKLNYEKLFAFSGYIFDSASAEKQSIS